MRLLFHILSRKDQLQPKEIVFLQLVQIVFCQLNLQCAIVQYQDVMLYAGELDHGIDNSVSSMTSSFNTVVISLRCSSKFTRRILHFKV